LHILSPPVTFQTSDPHLTHTLSLHDALPIYEHRQTLLFSATFSQDIMNLASRWTKDAVVVEVAPDHVTTETVEQKVYIAETEQKDRKSTRLNSSHVSISYAVFCLKKKKKYIN